MKIASRILIEDLKERTLNNIKEAKKLQLLSAEKLNRRNSEDSWSILECIEHLNLYGDFYIPEITNKIQVSNTKEQTIFKSGVLGNYFAKNMLPKDDLNKMKTFKDKNPMGSKLDNTTIDRFLNQQGQILNLLEKAHNVDLTKVKTEISISKLVKLKLGDTFRAVIYHNERHLVQANKVLINHRLSNQLLVLKYSLSNFKLDES